jgi:hypothetical protein
VNVTVIPERKKCPKPTVDTVTRKPVTNSAVVLLAPPQKTGLALLGYCGQRRCYVSLVPSLFTADLSTGVTNEADPMSTTFLLCFQMTSKQCLNNNKLSV